MKATATPGFNNLGLLFASGFAFLAIILAGGALHLVHLDQRWNWPLTEGWNSAPGLVPWLAIACIAASVALLALEWKSSGLASLRNWLAWITLPLLLAAVLWIILPTGDPGMGVWVLTIAVLVGALWMSVNSLKSSQAPGTPYFVAWRDLPQDALIILMPVIIGSWAAGDGRLDLLPAEVLYSVLSYPVYALVQLFIFLVIPATHMSKRGYSPASTAVNCAVIFSLAHWPNPLLMAGTGLAMLVWARQFLRGRSVLMLALVMGIAAVGFKFAMPQHWGWGMRIGPDYVEKRATFEAQAKLQADRKEAR